MAATTESIALKVLAALKVEYEREPSLLKCRPYKEILSGVAKRHRLDAADVQPADRFLKTNGLINAAQREDGLAALLNQKGIAFLDSHIAAQKEKRAWTLDRRIALYAVIAALISAAVAVMAWLSTR
jgi:hypothetical protein